MSEPFIPTYLSGFTRLMGDKPSVFKYLLDNGRHWNVTDATYKGRRFKRHMCFRNATILAQRGIGTYVEGYAIHLAGIPLEHAWVVDANGNVIDPTWRLEKDTPSEYFGVPFDLEKLESLQLISGFYGVFGNYKSCKALILGADDNTKKNE